MTINIQRALQIQGWMGEEELTWLAERASECMSIVEIGCWKGRTTVALAEHTKGVVHCVDSWREPGVFKEFLENVKHLKNLVVHTVDSLDGARVLDRIRFDFVFIDADHSYESAKSDILSWKPLIAPGGLISGHDYRDSFPGVIQAVDELIPNRQLLAPRNRCAIWFARL